MHTAFTLTAALAAGGLLAGVASAGVIVDADPFLEGDNGITEPNGNGSATSVATTNNAGNDNTTNISNVEVNRKQFTALGPIDIVFDVQNSGGTTEYFVREPVILNRTGQAFDTFTVELGFGFGDLFTRSPDDDGLDFDSPDFDPEPTSNGAFNTPTRGQDVLRFTGGMIPDQGSFSLQFGIDVPDGITSFTLRQGPSITPIPSPTAALGGLVGLAAIGLRRRTA